MLNETLISLFKRDFEQLRREIELYQEEEKLWVKAEGIKNSGGNLCLHLIGNLQHFFGAVLDNTGYKRDREFEFSGKISQGELLSEIDAAEKAVIETLQHLSSQDFADPYPVEVFGEEMSTEFFLTHLYGHFNYHLGQINYHRRLLT